MGIIIRDDYTDDRGSLHTEYYGYIHRLETWKTENGQFQVMSKMHYHPTKQARLDGKEPMLTTDESIGTSNLVSLHSQVYTHVKEKYEDVSDD
jgi:hypothetical protein